MTELVLSFPAAGGITLQAVGIQGPPGGGGGGGVTDGDKGGIIVSGTGAVWTVKAGSITDLMLGASAIALFAAASHTHVIANITGLQAALDGKAGTTHTHVAADVTDFAPTTRGTVLTGYAAAGSRTALAAADTILGAFNKIGKWLADLAAIAFSGSASDLSAGTVPAARMPAHTGDATSSAGSVALTLATVNSNVGSFGLAGSVAQFVVNAKGLITSVVNVAISIASTAISDSTAAGRAMLTAATAAAQTALLDVFTSGAKGLVPPSGGGTTNFLRADGTFAAPSGGSGDVTAAANFATDNRVIRSDGTTKGVQASAVSLADTGETGLPNIASPAAAATDTVNIFGSKFAGQTMPAYRGPLGNPELLQSMIGFGQWCIAVPAVGATVSIIGYNANAVGTGTTATLAGGSRRDRLPRIEYLVTTPATNAQAGWRTNALRWSVGGASAWEGGFYTVMHWGPATGATIATHRAFCGMWYDVAFIGDVDPSTLINMVGMAWDDDDTNIQFMHNDGSGVATKIDLGASFPVPTVDRANTYRLEMHSPPGSTQSVTYKVVNLETGAEATGTVTTNLPSNSTLLANQVAMSVGGTSSVIGIALGPCATKAEY